VSKSVYKKIDKNPKSIVSQFILSLFWAFLGEGSSKKSEEPTNNPRSANFLLSAPCGRAWQRKKPRERPTPDFPDIGFLFNFVFSLDFFVEIVYCVFELPLPRKSKRKKKQVGRCFIKNKRKRK
jgi:hypothetical protein